MHFIFGGWDLCVCRCGWDDMGPIAHVGHQSSGFMA